MKAYGKTAPDLVLAALDLQKTRPATVPPPSIIDRECEVVDCLYETAKRRLLLVIRRDCMAFRGVEKRDQTLHIEGTMPRDASPGWLWSWLEAGR